VVVSAATALVSLERLRTAMHVLHKQQKQQQKQQPPRTDLETLTRSAALPASARVPPFRSIGQGDSPRVRFVTPPPPSPRTMIHEDNPAIDAPPARELTSGSVELSGDQADAGSPAPVLPVAPAGAGPAPRMLSLSPIFAAAVLDAVDLHAAESAVAAEGRLSDSVSSDVSFSLSSPEQGRAIGLTEEPADAPDPDMRLSHDSLSPPLAAAVAAAPVPTPSSGTRSGAGVAPTLAMIAAASSPYLSHLGEFSSGSAATSPVVQPPSVPPLDLTSALQTAPAAVSPDATPQADGAAAPGSTGREEFERRLGGIKSFVQARLLQVRFFRWLLIGVC
jgi:hypothetical protein